MLIEFIYTSYASEPFLSEQLSALQKQCQDHNNPNQITGMLLYDNQQFMQVLEGEQAVIEALFKKIKSDPRHQQVKALIHTPITERNFANWSMGLVDISDSPDRPECIEFTLTHPSSLSQRLLIAFSHHFEDAI